MNKSFFLKNKNGFLVGLVIALFAVAALLLGHAGLLGDSMTKLTGNLIGLKKATFIRVSPEPEPPSAKPIGDEPLIKKTIGISPEPEPPMPAPVTDEPTIRPLKK